MPYKDKEKQLDAMREINRKRRAEAKKDKELAKAIQILSEFESNPPVFTEEKTESPEFAEHLEKLSKINPDQLEKAKRALIIQKYAQLLDQNSQLLKLIKQLETEVRLYESLCPEAKKEVLKSMEIDA